MLLLKSKLFGLVGYFMISLAFFAQVSGQEKEKYILGQEQKLEMIVHIFGEVQRPGEYRVRDNTTVLELISKAGGPTQFSKLSNVRLTRAQVDLNKSIKYFSDNSNGSNKSYPILGKRIIKIDLDKYLKKETAASPPLLRPGDVVYVPRNNWFRWRGVVTIARDLSVIASIYFIATRR
jgi:protein involved in polysaccharide export with SLBB domain